VARSLAAKGWRLALLDLKPGSAHELTKKFPGTTFHQTDVSSFDSLSSSFKGVWADHGRVDFVFANAGIVPTASFYAPLATVNAETDRDDVVPSPTDAILNVQVNLTGVILTTYLGLWYLRKTRLAAAGSHLVSPYRGGSIVATSSGAGLYPVVALPEYAAAKHGIVGFIRSIAHRVFDQHQGVRVAVVCPGSISTPLTRGYIAKGFPEEFLTDIEKVTDAVEALVEGNVSLLNGRLSTRGPLLPADLIGASVEVSGKDLLVHIPPVPENKSMKMALPLVSP
jgi:NAD(P)-dependent dehydrogenase (short-subunit alcohol dehydrogenase family)